MKTARLYDLKTHRVTAEIPIEELAPGYIRAKIEGVEGEVFIKADEVQAGAPFKHPPFTEEVRALMRQFEETFRDVYPRTVEQWEEGFRRDSNPEEIAIWANIGGAFNFFTRDKKLPLAARRDYFNLILTCFNNGPDAALATVQLEHLTKARARSVVERLKQNNS